MATANSLGILYRTQGMTDSSLATLKKNFQIATNKQASPYQMAMIYENLGETYFAGKEFTEALKYFNPAYTTFKQLKNKGDIAYEAFCMGKTYKALERYPLAEKYLLESYQLSDSLKMVNYQADASAELASLYALKSDWQQGYKFLRKTSELKDSIAVAEQIAQTNELREKYESEKQAQEIVLLRTQNELTEADNRKNRLIQYIFIILFLASILIGWLLFNRIRISKRLEQLTLRNRIAGDLHDDIGSALSSIDISSRVALAKKENPLVIQENLTKISQQVRKTMDSMSDIVWSINPANDSFENMLSRMREFATGICEPQKIEFVMFEPEDKNITITEADKRQNIFLIFKEAINNACKYSGCSRLEATFERRGKNRLLMQITDNGKGFDEKLVKKGNGLQNIRNRARQIGASISIQSIPGKGTTIELESPV